MQDAALRHLERFQEGLHAFALDTGEFPTEGQGLNALTNNTAIAGWDGPYILRKQVPRDPWGNDYVYHANPKRGVEFGICSLGPDGRINTADDIGIWSANEN